MERVGLIITFASSLQFREFHRTGIYVCLQVKPIQVHIPMLRISVAYTRWCPSYKLVDNHHYDSLTS